MNGDPEYCIDCQKQQIERAIKLSGLKKQESEKLKQEALAYSEAHITEVPADVGTVFHRMIKKRAGKNPFEGEKEEGTDAAQEILNHIKPNIKTLKDACRAAVAGNFVDVVTVRSGQELEKVADAFNINLAIDDYDKVKKYFKKGKIILYLLDNCGEHLFDLNFIKMLSKTGAEIISVGKESQITNDATVSDLKKAGFEQYSKVISIGSDCIGTNLKEASEEFLSYFETADLIISKGMGNYETLNDNPKRILFMLKAKCEPVANDLRVRKDENVLKFKEKEDEDTPS